MAQSTRGWCHCMANTYGTWLPGDPRGFRTRGHREHVAGDYKQPPVHDYTARHDRARKNLKHGAVVLTEQARAAVLEEFRLSLTKHTARAIAIAVCSTHVHILAQFPKGDETKCAPQMEPKTSAVTGPVRHIMGQAKQWSAKRLIREELVGAGPVWARKGKIVRITDQSHQRNVFRYILRHAEEGAAVWSFRDE